MARRKGTRTLEEHIAAAQAAETEEGCWPWQGNITEQGYGRFIRRPEPQQKAHRAVYVELVGPIPDGLTLDHACHTEDTTCEDGPRCRHGRCVRPSHLEPVEIVENWQRGRSPLRRNAEQEVCHKGHPLSGDNLYKVKPRANRKNGWRRCRACTLEYNREWRRTHPRTRT